LKDGEQRNMTDTAMVAVKHKPQRGDLRYSRSAATNHTDLLGNLDGRSAGARRFRDLVRAFIADLGGADNCSAVMIGLVRRLAAATVMAEALELKAVSGEPVDIGEYCDLASTTVRISQRLGLKRTPKNITPSLSEYLRTHHTIEEDAVA
jgi:hypothetical protein